MQRISESPSLLILAPRTHPNLIHLIDPLLKSNWSITLLVQKITPEFLAPKGLTIQTWDQRTQLSGERFDLGLIRFYPKGYREFIRRLERGAILVQYDQAPAGTGLTGSLIETLKMAKRLLLGRPRRRITPVVKIDTLRNSGRGICLPFRYPISVEVLTEMSEIGVPNFSWPNDGHLRIICIAKSGQRRKGVDSLLEALVGTSQPMNLLVLSSGVSYGSSRKLFNLLKISSKQSYERKLLRIENRLGSNVRVTKLEGLGHADTLQLVRESHMLALPSRREPFAISPLEALSLGKPVAVTGSNGSASYIPRLQGNLVAVRGQFARQLSTHLELEGEHLKSNRYSMAIKQSLESCFGTGAQWIAFLESELLEREDKLS